MLYLIALILVLAILFFWQAGRAQQKAGLPGGRVVYTDMRSWGKLEKPLYDARLGLTGKPDYLLEQGGTLIPIEVKTGRTPSAPYDSHIFQLAAYCLLVQRAYGKRPTHGLIKYPSRTFQVDYTPKLESELLALLDEIRSAQRKRNIPRSHDQPARCTGCGFRDLLVTSVYRLI
ncbi:MAG: CRISPR-associated protein Cas4, partial [Anaerolineae bacterium]|nr:CRISPR-associated protein Cas4 [Anaerolineae bacterium]